MNKKVLLLLALLTGSVHVSAGFLKSNAGKLALTAAVTYGLYVYAKKFFKSPIMVLTNQRIGAIKERIKSTPLLPIKEILPDGRMVTYTGEQLFIGDGYGHVMVEIGLE